MERGRRVNNAIFPAKLCEIDWLSAKFCDPVMIK